MFRFGSFELSPESKELRKNGLLIRLSPQPFQLFSILLERAGELVTRDELRDRLWGDAQTNVEFDAGVNRCIRQIRAVLNDNSDAPRYIETIPRRGYRFIAPVEITQRGTTSAQLREAEPPPDTTPALRQLWYKRRQVLVPSALTLAVLGFGVYWLVAGGRQHPADLTATPLAVALGDQYSPTFSPDGRQVAFAWNGEHRNNFDIYVKDISSPSPPLRITTSEEVDYSPAWSPDGRWIAFCRGTNVLGGGIWLIRPLGGPERKLIGLYSIAAPGSRDLAWSQDSKFLIVTSHLTPDSQSRISRVNVETGETKPLLTAPSGEEYMFPTVSPDGETVAFTRDTGPGIGSILLFSLVSGARPRVLPTQGGAHQNFGDVRNGYPAWTPDGRYIVFSSDSGGRRHLWLAPSKATGPFDDLGALGDGVTGASISRTGQLAFVHEEYDTNIWRLDLRRQISDPGPNPIQVIASTRLENNPAVSPDGRRLAFSSNQSGYDEIWISAIDGKDAAPLTSMNSAVTGSPDWSPDGRQIAFDSRAEGSPNIYVVDAGGGKPARLTSSGSSGVVPHWSADGHWIYYSSESTGRMEVWRIPSSGGTPEQMTTQSGFAAIPAADSKYLYYTSDNSPASSLWELELSSAKRILVASSVLNRAYALTPSGVCFIQGSPDAEEHSIFQYDRQSRKATLLFKLQHRIERGIALSSDARFLYYTGIDRANHELLIANHFWR